MKDGTVLVVGDGIVGLACAHRFLRAGIATTVIGPADGAASPSFGNAGHLALEQVEPLASGKSIRKALGHVFTPGSAIRTPPGEIRHWLPFMLRLVAASGKRRFESGTRALTSCMQQAAPAWRSLLEELGCPDELRESGHFIVWESAGGARRGRAHWGHAETGTVRFRDATAEEIERLESLIRCPVHDAVRFDGSGHFADPGTLLGRLEDSLEANGAERITTRARYIRRDERGRACVETSDGELLGADRIVVAAGVASGGLLEGIGHRVPMIAERGYHIEAAAPGWPADMPPVVFEDRALIATRFRSRLRVCGFVEFARAERPPDETRWRALERHAAAIGLPFEEPLSHWMGPRPTLPDYLPAIGRSPAAANLYYAFGHQHLGLTLAAMTAEVVYDLAAGRRPAVDPAPFDLKRFGRRLERGR